MLCNIFQRGKVFRTFKKKGCKLYPLLTTVFSSSTASGAFHNASTNAPQTSEEEHRLEEEYLGNVSGAEGNGEGDESGIKKRKSEGDIPGMRRMKKNSGKEKYDVLMDTWSQSMVARKERDLAKAERYKAMSSEVASTRVEEYSINECMTILEATPGVSRSSYNKALKYFPDPNWRKMFLLMSEDRRKDWLEDLLE